MKNIIKDIAATSPVAWGDIADKIDENFKELEQGSGGTGSLSSFTDKQCREAFVRQMNAKAATIGMHDTTFLDPTGRENISTAHDMCRCLLHASGYDRLQEIWSIPEYVLTFIKKDGSRRNATISHTLIKTAFAGSFNVMGGKGGSLNPGRTMPDGVTITDYISNMSCILQSRKSPEDFFAITTMGYYADKDTAYQQKIQAIKDVMSLIESGVAAPQESPLDDIAYEGKTYRQIFVTNNLAPNINGNELGKSVNGQYNYSLNSSAVDEPVILTNDEVVANYAPPYAFFIDSGQSANLTTSGNADKVGKTYFAAANVKVTRYVQGRLGVTLGTKDNVAIEKVTDGYEVVTNIVTPSSTSSGNVVFYLGSSGSADLAGYINNPVIINMDIFKTAPSKEKLTELYNEFTLRLQEAYENEIDNNASAVNADYVCAFKLPKYNARSFQNVNLTPAFTKNHKGKFYPASMTKIMTAMITLDYCPNLFEKVTLTQADIDAFPTSGWYANDILVGETMTIFDVLHIMLMPSSNAATEILSRVIGKKILMSKNL